MTLKSYCACTSSPLHWIDGHNILNMPFITRAVAYRLYTCLSVRFLAFLSFVSHEKCTCCWCFYVNKSQCNIKWNDIVQYDMIWYEWHNITWYDITRHDIKLLDLTWPDRYGEELTKQLSARDATESREVDLLRECASIRWGRHKAVQTDYLTCWLTDALHSISTVPFRSIGLQSYSILCMFCWLILYTV